MSYKTSGELGQNKGEQMWNAMQEKKQVVQLEHDNFTIKYFETIEGSYTTSLIPSSEPTQATKQENISSTSPFPGLAREGSYSQGDKVSDLSIMIIQLLKK